MTSARLSTNGVYEALKPSGGLNSGVTRLSYALHDDKSLREYFIEYFIDILLVRAKYSQAIR